jgi:putative protein kinase ArgK-like GTPase of G3E family
MNGQGVAELVDAIERFRRRPGAEQAARRRMRTERRLLELVSRRFMDHLGRVVLQPGELAAVVDQVAAGELDPYTAADALLARASGSARPA